MSRFYLQMPKAERTKVIDENAGTRNETESYILVTLGRPHLVAGVSVALPVPLAVGQR